MNKNIIIAILIVLIIAVVAAFALSHPAQSENGKLNTQINILSKDTLKNGEQIQFELKDAQGNALAGQNISIDYMKNGKTEKYSIHTDNDGKGYLTIDNEEPGKYDVTINYNGTDKYNGCNAKQTLTIEEGTSTGTLKETSANSTTSTAAYNNGTAKNASSTSTSSSSQAYYDSELNVYFDSNGRVIGGQSEGSYVWDLRNNPPVVDSEGNLI